MPTSELYATIAEMNTNKDWERWGGDNPYYGVYSDEKFLGKELDEVSKTEFYASGKADIEYLYQKIERLYGVKKRFRHAVDYGSGVGRLSFALTAIAEKVTGLDISSTMIEKARKHKKVHNIRNVKFVLTNEHVRGLPKRYDLVFSYITLQHIPPKYGMKIIQTLASGLEPDGCFALQVTFGLKRSWQRKLLLAMRENIAPVRWIANAIKGRPITMPNMRMFSYPMNTLFVTLQESGITDVNIEFTDHGGFLGVYITGRKQSK